MKRNKRKNTEVFINECIEVRGYKYDYSLVSYKNNKQKVKIICKDHGIFEQTPNCKINKINLVRIKFDDDIKKKIYECLS